MSQKLNEDKSTSSDPLDVKLHVKTPDDVVSVYHLGLNPEPSLWYIKHQ